MIYTVSTKAELEGLLPTLDGGDVVELLPGHYGDLSIQNFNYSLPITIRSSSSSDMAVFNSINITQSSNIDFDTIHIDFIPDEGTVEWSSAFRAVNDTSNISLRNSLIEGGPSVNGIPEDSEPGSQGGAGILGWPIGRGMTLDGSGFIIENNDISFFTKGIVLSGSDNVIRGNEIHNLRNSPLVGGGSDLLIEGNFFHSSTPWKPGGLGDHGDYIHFWTGAGQLEPFRNISIIGNTFAEGDGTSLLGIFLESNSEIPSFENIKIENNYININNAQAMRLEGVVGGVISNNTLTMARAGEIGEAPTIRLHDQSRDVLINNNIVSAPVSGTGTSYNILSSDNLVLDWHDVDSPYYVGRVFLASSLYDADFGGLMIVPGGPAEGLGAFPLRVGSESSVTPAFQVNTVPDAPNTLVFDASFSVDGGGNALPEGTTFVWQFGDGSTASGVRVQHSFAEPGYHDARLTVTLPDGSAHQARATIGLAGEQVLSFNAQDGRFYTHGFGEQAALAGSDAGSVDTAGGKAIDLGAPGTVAAVAKEEIRRFFGADEFEINMTLKADAPLQSFGEIARIHTGMMISVEQNGALNFGMATDEGWFTVKTAGVRINDGAEHDISIRYDNDTDRLEILVDGNLMGTAAASGSLAEMKHWGLTFGNPWGSDNFDGKLSAFSIDAPSNDFPVYEETDATVGTSVPGPDQEGVPPVEVPAGTEEPQDETAAPPAGESPPAEEEARQEQGVLPENAAGIDAPADSVIGEIHKVTLTHAESMLRLDNTYENPVVIAQSMTANGGQPFAVRLSQVSSNEIRLSLQEPNYFDGLHVPEDVVIMVLEAGVHILPDGTRIEAGTLTSDKLSGAGFESVAFEHGFDTTPAILSQVQTRNGEDYVVTRQRDADGSGFQLTMQEEEALNGGSHLPETIGWVAIESGAGNWSGLAFEAGSTGDRVRQKGAEQEFAGDFDEAPLVLSGISSFRGPDTAWSAVRNVSATGFTTWVQEEQSRDKEMRHQPESVDFIAFANTGTLRGTTVETVETALAFLSSDSESGTGAFPALDDYVLDVAALGTEDSAVVLVDDAHVVAGSEGSAVRFDGDRDFVALGRLQQFETADQLSYSVTFQRDDPEADAQRLVWNHLKTGLTIEGDSLRIHVASAERSFADGFVIRDAGLLDSERHEARVIIDSVADRLQVVLDGGIVLDERGVDLDLTADAGRQSGWSLGTAWDRFYEGEVSDFRIEAAADFIEDRPLHEQDGLLLSA